MLFKLAFVIGLIFTVYYALKYLKKDQLKKWGIGLLIVAILGSLIVGALGGGYKHGKFGKKGFGHWGSKSFMSDCLEDTECAAAIEKFKENSEQ